MENPSRCMSFPVLCLFLFLVSDEAVLERCWPIQEAPNISMKN